MSVLTLHLKITLMGEYTSLSTPQSYKGRNDLEISNYFEKLQFKFNKFKCFVCSNKTVSGCFTQKQSLTAKQAPALFALCWSATYIHPNRNQIVKNKSQQNQISSIFVANCPEALLSLCPRCIIAPMERRPEPAPASPYLERKTLNGDIPEVTQTWQDPNSFQIVH